MLMSIYRYKYDPISIKICSVLNQTIGRHLLRVPIDRAGQTVCPLGQSMLRESSILQSKLTFQNTKLISLVLS